MSAPRIGQHITVTGTVRTVEALAPEGHYRVTLDVTGRPKRRVVDGHTDECPTPGYAGKHVAVGAGAMSSPYLCHGCNTWFTLDDPAAARAAQPDGDGGR